MSSTEIDLSSAIAHLRKELIEAIAEGDDKSLRFEVKSIDVELKCTVKTSAEAGASAKFWVINTEGKGAISDETIQTVKLSLLPKGKSGDARMLHDIELE